MPKIYIDGKDYKDDEFINIRLNKKRIKFLLVLLEETYSQNENESVKQICTKMHYQIRNQVKTIEQIKQMIH